MVDLANDEGLKIDEKKLGFMKRKSQSLDQSSKLKHLSQGVTELN